MAKLPGKYIRAAAKKTRSPRKRMKLAWAAYKRKRKSNPKRKRRSAAGRKRRRRNPMARRRPAPRTTPNPRRRRRMNPKKRKSRASKTYTMGRVKKGRTLKRRGKSYRGGQLVRRYYKKPSKKIKRAKRVYPRGWNPRRNPFNLKGQFNSAVKMLTSPDMLMQIGAAGGNAALAVAGGGFISAQIAKLLKEPSSLKSGSLGRALLDFATQTFIGTITGGLLFKKPAMRQAAVFGNAVLAARPIIQSLLKKIVPIEHHKTFGLAGWLSVNDMHGIPGLSGWVSIADANRLGLSGSRALGAWDRNYAFQPGMQNAFTM